MKKKIAIFASGSGSNAENIVKYFAGSERVETSLIISNKADSYVLERAKRLNIPSVVWNKKAMEEQKATILGKLRTEKINLIVLAGYLLKVPDYLIAEYPSSIVNIHPALLPKYGGKGMYGDNVHKAVVAAQEKESGITIHFVNEHYDEGQIIFQARCEVLPSDDFEMVAQKIHALEHEHFPRVIEEVLETKWG